MDEQSYIQFLETLELYDIASVAEEAEVSSSTLYFWLSGKHVPRMETLVKVAPIIGFEFNLTKL